MQPVDNFNNDIAYVIFTNLNARELIRSCSRLSKKWRGWVITYAEQVLKQRQIECVKEEVLARFVRNEIAGENFKQGIFTRTSFRRLKLEYSVHPTLCDDYFVHLDRAHAAIFSYKTGEVSRVVKMLPNQKVWVEKKRLWYFSDQVLRGWDLPSGVLRFEISLTGKVLHLSSIQGNLVVLVTEEVKNRLYILLKDKQWKILNPPKAYPFIESRFHTAHPEVYFQGDIISLVCHKGGSHVKVFYNLQVSESELFPQVHENFLYPAKQALMHQLQCQTISLTLLKMPDLSLKWIVSDEKGITYFDDQEILLLSHDDQCIYLLVKQANKAALITFDPISKQETIQYCFEEDPIFFKKMITLDVLVIPLPGYMYLWNNKMLEMKTVKSPLQGMDFENHLDMQVLDNKVVLQETAYMRTHIIDYGVVRAGPDRQITIAAASTDLSCAQLPEKGDLLWKPAPEIASLFPKKDAPLPRQNPSLIAIGAAIVAIALIFF